MEESVVIWIALFLIHFSSSVCPAARDSPGCDRELNEQKCVYELQCLNEIDDDIYSFESEDCSTFTYYGRSLYGLHVIYTGLADEIPKGNDVTVQIIIRLDLSGNGYNTSPNLTNMIHLAYLNLSRNNLTTAKLYNVKYQLPKLVELDLSFNKINTIEVGRVNVFDNLRTLNLSHNDLVNVPNATFGDFTELLTLDLSYNLISTIEIFTFEGLKELKSLYLSNNRISDINGAFFRFSRLLNLDVSHNRISVIKFDDLEKPQGLEVFFKNGIHNLRTLNLSHNDLVDVPNATFGDFTELLTLDLSHNLISTIGILTFEGLKQLNSLYLSNNKISETNGAFFRFSRLQNLDLSHNRLSEIKLEDFEKLQGLFYLNLTHNSILSIESPVFTNMNLLQTLKLGNNKLQDISQISFINNTKLDYLDISHNELNVLPSNMFKEHIFVFFDIASNNLEGALSKGTFEGLGNVTLLDLSNQQLTALEDNAFHGVEAIDSLYLSNNKLQIISDKTFINLTNLIMLDLSHNNLSDLHFDTSHLINLKVLHLHNNMITQIKHVNFQGLHNLNVLNLSSNQINKLEPGAFKDNDFLQILNISHNILTTVSYGALAGLLRLKTLDLSYNNIKIIDSRRFYEVPSLKILILDNNIIDFIETEEFFGTQLEELSIGGNKIPCETLVNFKKRVSFKISAINKYESIEENVNGINCTSEISHKTQLNQDILYPDQTNLLSDIRDSLHKMENKDVLPVPAVDGISLFLGNISQEVRKLTNDYDTKMPTLINLCSMLVKENASKTDQIVILLEKFLMSINEKPVSQNVSNFNDLMPYIDNVKNDIESNLLDVKSKINELERKLDLAGL